MWAMERSFSSGWASTRGERQAGHLVPVGNGVRQSRHKAGMGEYRGKYGGVSTRGRRGGLWEINGLDGGD